jgi:hypothetical protein
MTLEQHSEVLRRRLEALAKALTDAHRDGYEVKYTVGYIYGETMRSKLKS